MSTETWALLWSKQQNCFHIEPASDLFKKNVRAFHEDREINDYHPIHIGSREACEMAANFERYLLNERDYRRA